MEGEPTPTVSWFKNGLPLHSDRHVAIETDEFSSLLVVRRVSRHDGGEYKMVAKNACGSADVSFRLSVTDVPSAPANFMTSDVTHDRVTLSWSKPRSDGGCAVESYVIEMRELTGSYWTNIGRVDASRHRFTATNLLPGTEYYFRCVKRDLLPF